MSLLLKLSHRSKKVLTASHPARSTTPCDCAAHRAMTRDRPARAKISLSALLPVVACAVCPACLAVWTPVLAGLGLGLALTEAQHTSLLLLAIAFAVVSAAVRARTSRAWAPLVLTLLGGTALLASHDAARGGALSALGALCFVTAAITGRTRSASRSRAPHFSPNESES